MTEVNDCGTSYFEYGNGRIRIDDLIVSIDMIVTLERGDLIDYDGWHPAIIIKLKSGRELVLFKGYGHDSIDVTYEIVKDLLLGRK